MKHITKIKVLQTLCLGFLCSLLILFGTSQVVSADIQSLSPNTAYWGQLVYINGEGFGDFDPENSKVLFVDVDDSSNTIEAEILYPATVNWSDTLIAANTPPGIEEKPYNILVQNNGAEFTSPFPIQVIQYYSPPNLYGTPDYTSEYIISNTQAINVSDAIRQISQSFLLPLKDTIDKIGDHILLALNLELAFGDDAATTSNTIYGTWAFARNLGNGFFLLVLIGVGYMTMFRVNSRIYRYSLRNLMPRLVFSLLLVNGSYFFARIFIDFTLVITYSILDNFALNSADGLALRLLGELRMSLYVVFMLAYYLLIVSLMSVVLIFLVLRTVVILLFTAAAPLACLSVAIPRAEVILKQWVKLFLKFLLYGPIIAFLINVGVTISENTVSSDTLVNNDLLRSFIGTATLITILVLPVILNNIFTFFRNVIAPESLRSVPGRTQQKNQQKTEVKVETQRQRLDLHEANKEKIALTAKPVHKDVANKFQNLLKSDSKKSSPLVGDVAHQIYKAYSGRSSPSVLTEGSADASATVIASGSGTSVSQQKESKESIESTDAGVALNASASQDQSQESKAEVFVKKDKNNDASSLHLTDSSAVQETLSTAQRKVKRSSGDKKIRTSPKEQAKQKASSRLFSTAPLGMIVNWLKDKTKKKIIREGIVAEEGNVQNERAVAIFDQQPGKELLNDMYLQGNSQEQFASSNMIGNVFSSYPDRMHNVVQQATKSPPPIQQAAQTILQAGIQRLGQRILEEPDNERLQKVAEKMVLYAPHLLTGALSAPEGDGVGFIKAGIDQVAHNMGEGIRSASQEGSLGEMMNEDSKRGKSLKDLGNLAGQTLLFPQLNMGSLGKTQEERMFVVSGLLSQAPNRQQVHEKFVQALESEPDNKNLQQTAAEFVKHNKVEEIAKIEAPILGSAKSLMSSKEFRRQPDQSLVAKVLLGQSSDDLQKQALHPDLLSGLSMDGLLKNLPPSQQAQSKQELSARLILGAHVSDIETKQPNLLQEAQKTLPDLTKSNAELAQAASLKLVAESSNPDGLAAETKQIARQALSQPGVTEKMTSETLQKVTRRLLTESTTEEMTELVNDPEASKVMFEHAVMPLSHKVEDYQALADILTKNQSLLQKAEPKQVAQLVNNVAPEDIPQLFSDASTSAAVTQKLLGSASEGEVLSPELAAATLLMTPDDQLEHLPWSKLKEVMKFLLKLDRSSPIYAKLQDKVDQTKSGESPSIEQGKPKQGEESLPGKSQNLVNQSSQQTVSQGLISTGEQMKIPAIEGAISQEVDQSSSKAIETIRNTPFEQLEAVDVSTVRQAMEDSSKVGEFTPETSAKLMTMLPIDDLADIDPKMRQSAASYLTDKEQPGSQDAELAARIVASTPGGDLQKLNESILALAATIAKSNVSFADRDQVQKIISDELSAVIHPKKEEEMADDNEDDDMLKLKFDF